MFYIMLLPSLSNIWKGCLFIPVEDATVMATAWWIDSEAAGEVNCLIRE